MKEMMKKVRERREGFTMAELLIVVAIIAVLVAIAIPVFSSQLDKANAAADAANIRAGYADVQTKAILNEATAGDYYLKKDGTVTATKADADFVAKGNSNNLDDNTIGGMAVTWTKDQKIKYTVTAKTDTTMAKVSKIAGE